MLFFFLKQQLFYFSPQRTKQKMPLLTAKLNSFRQIGWILLRKECGVKFEYHQRGNMDGWIPKGRVQIKPDRCSYERYIRILDQKSSRQCHSKDTWFCIHRKSRTQFLLGCLILVCCCEPQHISSTNSLQDPFNMTHGWFTFSQVKTIHFRVTNYQ